MIPRLSYLPAYIQGVISHFKHAIPSIHLGNALKPNQVWFDHEGIPLKWHYPVGVLFDLFLTERNQQKPRCPWKLGVHFHSFPNRMVLPLENEKSIESHFMQSLKQSTFARLGSSKLIMRMSEAQQRQMWQSVVQRSGAKFNEAIKELYDTNTADSPIPVRLLVGNAPFVQLRVLPEEHGTLQKLLCWAWNGSSTDAGNVDNVMIHGVLVPTSLAVALVYRYFAYPDGFLYIVVGRLQEE
ncbi:hypothetical protein ABG067_006454 [Albugo candida]